MIDIRLFKISKHFKEVDHLNVFFNNRQHAAVAY